MKLEGRCKVEWTNTGPYSNFVESITLEVSPHVANPVIQLVPIFHPFVAEFETHAAGFILGH